jgi:hypothetical protein
MLLLAVEIYIFGISSAAISTNFIQMIIARIKQRIGKSLFPIALGIMRDKFDHSNFGLDLNPSTLSSEFLCDTKNIEFSEWIYYLFSHLGETPEQRFQKQKMSPLEHQGSWTGLPKIIGCSCNVMTFTLLLTEASFCP